MLRAAARKPFHLFPMTSPYSSIMLYDRKPNCEAYGAHHKLLKSFRDTKLIQQRVKLDMGNAEID